MTDPDRPLHTVVDALERLGLRVRHVGDQVDAQCPAHDDAAPSLSVRYDRTAGKVLIHCHVGCAADDVIGALGLTWADLRDRRTDRVRRREIVATYPYVDEHGEPLFEKVRYAPKDFRVRRPDGAGGWHWSIGDAPRVLYRLPQVLDAIAAGQPVLLVEGEKDADRVVAADLGVSATANYDGAAKSGSCPKWRKEYAAQLRGGNVLVVADNDDAGHAHARAAAAALQGVAAQVRIVRAALDWPGADISDHLDAGLTLDELVPVALLTGGAKSGQPPTAPPGAVKAAAAAAPAGDSQATKLYDLAVKRYTLHRTPDGEPFALPKAGPRLALILRGRGSLRAELSQAYRKQHPAVASQSALSDALMALQGKALGAEVEPLHLRVARLDDVTYVDLGRVDGGCVLIERGRWDWVRFDEVPVTWRRTALTGQMPVPRRGGSLDALWALLPVAERYRPVLAAWLVLALLFPDLPHPVLLLSGEHGTGKTSATRIVLSLVDPSAAQLRKAPRDAEGAATMAAGSYAIGLDNLSDLPDWLSDTICRWVSGDGDVRRRLYTDDELHVVAFRRVTALNGIDLGALRGDLADRLAHIRLEEIAEDARRLDADMTAAWERAHPRVLGAVLDLAAAVLVELPDVYLPRLPRMADYARVLAAVDRVLDTTGLATYLGLAAELAHDAVTSDPVLVALTEGVRADWVGTSAELLAEIAPDDPTWRKPRDWPTARSMTSILHRQAPALRRVGWTVEETGRGTRSRALTWHLVPPPETVDEPDQLDLELRESGNNARDARDARSHPVSAAQQRCEGASDSASDAVGASERRSQPASVDGECERQPSRPNDDARTPREPLTSTNGTAASVASVASDIPPPSQFADRWRVSGDPVDVPTEDS